MAALDSLGADAFVRALAPLFEGAPRFVARVAADRPYGSYGPMLERARDIARAMPEDEQMELLAAHPRIGAATATVSTLSFREQGYDTGAHADTTLQERLDALNAAYEKRFDFRFVIFVAGRTLSVIADLMEGRLTANPDEERARALEEVMDIAADRLRRHAMWEEGGR